MKQDENTKKNQAAPESITCEYCGAENFRVLTIKNHGITSLDGMFSALCTCARTTWTVTGTRTARDFAMSAIHSKLEESQAIVDSWLAPALQISKRIKDGSELLSIFSEILSFIWLNSWRGACHDTSAILYILLTEHGLSPNLCIGEVAADLPERAEKHFFGHSWVEVSDSIFDPAISMPQLGAPDVSAPIFGSIDLFSGKKTSLQYGVTSSHGLDQPALINCKKNLHEFALAQPRDDIWSLSVAIGKRIGLPLKSSDIATRYGSVYRTLRTEA